MKDQYIRPMTMSEPEFMEDSILAGSYQTPVVQSKEFLIDEADEAAEDFWGYKEFEPWQDE